MNDNKNAPIAVGMFRTGATKETHGDCFISHFTAGVFEIQPDKFLVNFPEGLNNRRPAWIGKDKLINWVEGYEPKEG